MATSCCTPTARSWAGGVGRAFLSLACDAGAPLASARPVAQGVRRPGRGLKRPGQADFGLVRRRHALWTVRTRTAQVHIDFGFLLSNSPGKNIGFESAPFKLTREWVDVMGGTRSPWFAYFKLLVVRGMLEARRRRRGS